MILLLALLSGFVLVTVAQVALLAKFPAPKRYGVSLASLIFAIGLGCLPATQLQSYAQDGPCFLEMGPRRLLRFPASLGIPDMRNVQILASLFWGASVLVSGLAATGQQS